MPKKQMLINFTPDEECRIAITENGQLEEFYQERPSAESHVNNIYKGRVTNVEPSIQAAFIDFGLERNGFLHISDLHPMYFGKKDREETERVGHKTPRRDRPLIQQCLRRGQEILVQVLKEGIGTKGPTLTSYLSIPGRFIVMMPFMERLGVSRKIDDDEARRAMRKTLDQLNPPEGFGFIIRTAGVGRTKADLKRDLAYLQRLWRAIESRKKSTRIGELYTESDLVIRTIRDVFSSDIDQIIVDDPGAADRARAFLRIVNPRAGSKVVHYADKAPLLERFGVEQQIEGIHRKEVPLPSGGSLVIESTEALVAIDVNSGKMRDHGDAEATAYNVNLEAVDEICRQLRIRDLGGVVVNDLIDMRDPKHRRTIEQRFRDNLKKDRARTRTLPISQFGIVEMTRQRMRPSLKKSVYTECRHCHGDGFVMTPESVLLHVMRKLSLAMHHDKLARLELTVSPDVAFQLLNRRRQELAHIEAATGKEVLVRVNGSGPIDYISLVGYDARGGSVDVELLPKLGEPTLIAAEAVELDDFDRDMDIDDDLDQDESDHDDAEAESHDTDRENDRDSDRDSNRGASRGSRRGSGRGGARAGRDNKDSDQSADRDDQKDDPKDNQTDSEADSDGNSDYDQHVARTRGSSTEAHGERDDLRGRRPRRRTNRSQPRRSEARDDSAAADSDATRDSTRDSDRTESGHAESGENTNRGSRNDEHAPVGGRDDEDVSGDRGDANGNRQNTRAEGDEGEGDGAPKRRRRRRGGRGRRGRGRNRDNAENSENQEQTEPSQVSEDGDQNDTDNDNGIDENHAEDNAVRHGRDDREDRNDRSSRTSRDAADSMTDDNTGDDNTSSDRNRRDADASTDAHYDDAQSDAQSDGTDESRDTDQASDDDEDRPRKRRRRRRGGRRRRGRGGQTTVDGQEADAQSSDEQRTDDQHEDAQVTGAQDADEPETVSRNVDRHDTKRQDADDQEARDNVEPVRNAAADIDDAETDTDEDGPVHDKSRAYLHDRDESKANARPPYESDDDRRAADEDASSNDAVVSVSASRFVDSPDDANTRDDDAAETTEASDESHNEPAVVDVPPAPRNRRTSSTAASGTGTLASAPTTGHMAPTGDPAAANSNVPSDASGINDTPPISEDVTIAAPQAAPADTGDTGGTADKVATADETPDKAPAKGPAPVRKKRVTKKTTTKKTTTKKAAAPRRKRTTTKTAAAKAKAEAEASAAGAGADKPAPKKKPRKSRSKKKTVATASDDGAEKASGESVESDPATSSDDA